jgi:hypothetical protein
MDEFTARVYEENIRVSLRCQNINYFNQCLSQLMDLYKAKIRSENKHVGIIKLISPWIFLIKEFLAYRIIFYTLGEMETELNKALLQLTPHDYDNPQIKLALRYNIEIHNKLAMFLGKIWFFISILSIYGGMVKGKEGREWGEN